MTIRHVATGTLQPNRNVRGMRFCFSREMIPPRHPVGVRAEDLYLLLNDLRRIALVAALIVGTTLPHVAAAQSADGSDPAAVDDGTPALVDDAAPADSVPATDTIAPTVAPAEVAPTAEQPVVVPSPLPTPTTVATATPVPAPFVHASLVKTDKIVQLLPDPAKHFAPTGYDNSAEGMNQVPSSVGAPLFNNIWFPIAGQSFHEMRLAPSDLATYTYTCPTGQCVGSAEAVWRALPVAQEQQYLTALVQAAKANQTWNPSVFSVGVRVGAGGAMLGCARLTTADPTVTFPSVCP